MGSVSTTFSLQVDQLLEIEDFAGLHNLSRSRTIQYLIRMGLVYLKILEEQRDEMDKTLESKAEAA